MWEWLEENFDKTKNLSPKEFLNVSKQLKTPPTENRDELINELKELYEAHRDESNLIHTISFTELSEDDVLPKEFSEGDEIGNFKIIRS